MITRRRVLKTSACLLFPPVWAKAAVIHPTLVLALDVSSSTRTNLGRFGPTILPHWRLQRDGHIHALQKDDIARALIAQQFELYALAWAGSSSYLFEPVIMRRQANLNFFCQQLYATHPEGTSPTHLPGNFGTNHLQLLRFLNQERSRWSNNPIVDICTDEQLTQSGETCRQQRDEFVKGGGTINVLAIESAGAPAVTPSMRENIASHFVETVYGFNDFVQGIERKLRSEVMM